MPQLVELPLLHDHHSHVSLYAALEGVTDLGALDRERAFSLLASLPPDRLNLVKGWRSDRLALDSASLQGLPPLLIINASLHGYALSPAALPHLRELWPEFGERWNESGWGERHLPELFVFYGKLAGLTPEKLLRFMAHLETLGIGSAEDMTILGAEAIGQIRDAGLADRIEPWATPDVFGELGGEERGLCRGIKLFLDGSLGARSAALDEAFSDGGIGQLLYSDTELEALLAELASFKTGLSVHALGGRAIEQILVCLRRLRGNGIEFSAVRLEHVQFITEGQGRAARDLGCCLSLQPNFSADSVDYRDRLSVTQLAANNPFRLLIDRLGFQPGRDLVFGSDGMPHGPAEALRWALFPAYAGQQLQIAEYQAGSRPPTGRQLPETPQRFLADPARKSVSSVMNVELRT